MNFLRLTFPLALAFALLAPGCGFMPSNHPYPTTTAPSTKPLADNRLAPLHHPPTSNQTAPPSPSTQHAIADPRPVVPVAVRLNVYQFTVPARTISRDDAFWKHIDEHAVDVATYDLLYKNGLRVGLGRQNDWDFFRAILARQHVSVRAGYSTSQKPDQLEVSLKDEQDSQEIFWFDSTSFLTGHRYDHCEDLISVYYSPVPRHTGDVALTVIPFLRSRREQIHYTVREDEVLPHFTEDYPEYLFDLRLRTVIGNGQFLVIAPSPAAQVAHTLGRTFFRHDGKGDEFETILLISPAAFRLEDPATQPLPK